MSQSAVKVSVFKSVFVKCTLLIALTAALISVSLSLQARKLAIDVAHLGAQQLADKVTGGISRQVGGAFKFGKYDTIKPMLETALVKSNGSYLLLAGVDVDGQLVVETGDGNSPVAIEAKSIAALAAKTGERQLSADRLTVAYPVTIGSDPTPLGALVTVASTDPMLFVIRKDLRQANVIAGILLLTALILSALLLWFTISKPLTRVGEAMQNVGEGDLDTEIPHSGRGDEIGQIARQLDAFRSELKQAEAISADAIRKGAGFQNSSAAMIMLGTDGEIEAFNPAAQSLLSGKLALIKAEAKLEGLYFGRLSPALSEAVSAASGKDQHHCEVVQNGISLSVEINTIKTAEGETAGAVIELADITDTRIGASFSEALDAENVRADFDAAGMPLKSNSRFADMMGSNRARLSDIISFEGASGRAVMGRLMAGESLFGRFEFTKGNAETAIVDGAVCAVRDAAGEVFRLIVTGRDVTKATLALEASNAKAEQMQSEQATAVSGIRDGLEHLSRGDFTVRINTPFAPDYETLRQDFNEAIALVENTVISINEKAENINGEIASISESSTNLSERTEKQASTLAESVAAITEISAAVTAAADGAREAERLVSSARTDAENSEQVVEKAIDAVGKIEASSQRISQIVNVIDDIAFQTNLLALNAGVEAARAGDSGRGFAVVASEVRELAQRSSKAAKEISDVIQKSRVDVENGVQLVRRAGDALNEIAGSVSQISDHVGGIATSSNEQSDGLSQISSAMNQLDTVTQHNVGTFEETAAAISVLSNETVELKQALDGFKVNWSKPSVSIVSTSHAAEKAPALRQVANGAPVSEFHVTDNEDAWTDF